MDIRISSIERKGVIVIFEVVGLMVGGKITWED